MASYLGRDGPQWNPDLEEVDGLTVLVITVEAPRQGDPIFTLEKQFESYRNGDVFVRRAGKTEKASAVDIRALTSRARAKTPSGLALDLERDRESIQPPRASCSAAGSRARARGTPKRAGLRVQRGRGKRRTCGEAARSARTP